MTWRKCNWTHGKHVCAVTLARCNPVLQQKTAFFEGLESSSRFQRLATSYVSKRYVVACAQHAGSLRAACRQPARSMPAPCAHLLRSVLKMSTESWSARSLRAACRQPARSMRAYFFQVSTEFFKPCQTPFLLKFPRTISSP